MLKMDHLTIRKMEDEIELVNHKYKCSNISIPRSCDYLKGCDNNNYNLMLPEISPKPFLAVCDLKTLDGGWTVIQRRQDGSENFYRNWSEYAEGFGNVNGEFFIGLEKLHALTTSGDIQELYIILEDFEGIRKYARYGEFEIDSESNEYMLTVGEYSGNAGDSLKGHNGMKFSTKDRDNDLSKKNCAEVWKAAWWYTVCYNSNLNGQYYVGEKIKSEGGVVWGAFKGLKYSLKFTQMMIRTRDN
ncbi:fibrinogen C domain-containing protein 1-like isoform 1-T4 [Cochliomyia hominivorax]